MLDFRMAFFTVLVVAGGTFLTRVFPFLIFSGKKEVPDLVRYLGKVLPPAVIAILVVYCFKNIQLLTFPFGIPEAISIIAVVVIHVLKRNNLLSIGAGTILYMFLIQKVFV